MTYDDFIHLIKHPAKLKDADTNSLLELTTKYPYFRIVRWLYLNNLYLTKNILVGQELKKTAINTFDRRNLYFFIHPEEIENTERIPKDRSKGTGSYFDMIELIENKTENDRSSLQLLAARLHASRKQLISSQQEPKDTLQPINEELNIEKDQSSSQALNEEKFDALEKQAKALVKDKRYEDAIVILDKLNLINPKKSIYFADQIRFLKKIINN